MASGTIAKHFIDWVNKKRVADNIYHVTCHKANTTSENIGKNINIIQADPSSYSKLQHIMREHHYSNIFVVMEDKEEVEYTLKNIALIDNKMRTIVVNQWDEPIDVSLDNLTVIQMHELMATHLYDNLPNVPLVAQNVGLGRGEIMEIHVPYGSSFAYRHVGSILQRKWTIAALYRNDKQILPTTATMIRPNDTLLVLGKPLVLDGVYKTINKRIGLFPEPFGRNIYLVLDFRYDQKYALHYLEESIYLMQTLRKVALFVRILYPSNFTLMDTIKSYETDMIRISVAYDEEEHKHLIEYDIHQYDVGLILNSIPAFESGDLKPILYALKKLVYLFGNTNLYGITKCVVLMSGEEKMESISTTAFDIAQSLSLDLMLADYSPEGDFENKQMIIEHYETLTHIFNLQIEIEQRIANPIRELSHMQKILQIVPFEKNLNSRHWMKLISTNIQDFLLTSVEHPKLLVPFALTENKDEH